MRPTQLPYDGLWRCLCPAFYQYPSPASTSCLRVTQPLASRNPAASSRRLRQSRQYGTAALATDKPIDEVVKTRKRSDRPRDRDTTIKLSQTPRSTRRKHFDNAMNSSNPETATTEHIIAALNILRGVDENKAYKEPGNRRERIHFLVKFLLQKRGHPLNAFIYECMMDAMIDPAGSVSGIRKLLVDMAAQEIAPTATLCQSVLKALAVHPDYTLRQEIVDMMKQYWYEIDTSAEQSIMLGMLRDGQYELALAKFEKLIEDKVRLDLWVYDIFIVVFSHENFLDEMLEILQHRKHAKGTDDALRSLLLHCLDVFSRAYHHGGTTYVWDVAVKSSLLNVPNGIVENVLGTAARHGDTTLATSALEILSNRGRVVKHQYEGVVEAFARAKELPGALRVLDIMDSNAIGIDRGSTRLIFQAMREDPKLIDGAIQTIRDAHRNRPIIHDAIRVTIEALVRQRGSEGAAMDLYNDFLLLTGKQPDYAILEDLILHSKDDETDWSLAMDYTMMVADKTMDNPQVYDKMIQACAERKDWDLAFELVERNKEIEEARHPGQKLWRKRLWVPHLVEHALAAEVDRIWKIVDEVCLVDDEVSKAVQIQVQRYRMLKTMRPGKAAAPKA